MVAAPVRVAVIGGGMSGILCAIELRRLGIDFTVYEKAERLGGTWRENTYPGLACDVPAHSYTYSFARNPDWSRFYAGGDEIQRYCAGPEPYDKAGGYGIQGLAALFIERIEGSYTGVMGLPLFETGRLLAQAGFKLL